MMLNQLDKIEDQSTEILISKWIAALAYGLHTSEYPSRLTMSRFFTRWVSSPASPKRQVSEIEIHIQISRPTLHSRYNLPLPTLTTYTMSIKANHDPKIWCDLCKLQWGQIKDKDTGKQVWHLRAMTPARWIVVSETAERKGRTRHYCVSCANDVQTWQDGTIWTFREQLDFALGKEVINGLELE